MNGCGAAAALGLVNQIVMDQRGGVDQLDCRSRVQHPIEIIVAELSRQQGQRRADALAARGQDMLAGDPNYWQTRLHALDNNLIYYLKIGK
jgi:hypothetical protein